MNELESLRQQIAKLETQKVRYKKAKGGLREREKRYKSLIQAIPDIIYKIDPGGNFAFVSDAVKQLGYNPKELIGKHFKEIVHPDDFKTIASSLVLTKYKGKTTGDADSPKLFDERRAGKRMTRNLVVRLLVKNPKGIPKDYHYGEVYSVGQLPLGFLYGTVDSSGKWDIGVKERGEFLGTVGIIRDITPFKEVEKKLRQNETFTSALLKSNPIETTVVDLEGKIIRFNGEGKNSGDRSPKIGDVMYKDYARNCEINMYDKLMKCLRSGKPKEFPEQKYGGQFLSTIISPFNHGAIIISQDITKYKQAQEELQRSFGKLEKALDGTVNSLASMLEMKDPYTAGHQHRVANLARSIGEELGLPDEQVKAIYMAGLIHDIGKISVPAEILSKPSTLSEVEMALVKNHSQIGYDILKGIEFPWPIAKIVIEHHERGNGSGYPGQLTAKKISLGAKILAVADVVEAMTSHRPYRPALGIDRALDEISQNKRTLYDTKVADACLKLFRKGKFKLSISDATQ